LMVQVVQTAIQASKFDIPMIITGESGVGKSMIARLVHQLSPRRNYPFVDVNCAALTPSLVESELFGHEGGAFTGASASGKKGLFETADQGTLFLDEIGEIPLSMQVKLLKFLETMELRRVGGTTPIRINTRIIAATNQDLERMVDEGRFRRDLFFRLNVVPMRIPRLGRRSEDIVPLAQSFIDRFNQEFSTQKVLTKPVCQMLSQYHFPGNVRELENLIKRLVTMTPQDKIELAHLPPLPTRSGPSRAGFPPAAPMEQARAQALPRVLAEAEGGAVPLNDPVVLPMPKPSPPDYQTEVNHFEKELLRQAVAQYGSQRKAATALGISQSTLSRKLKR
ncbi:MAG: sigma 54-interacting transcriptional regulator, partial [Desulfobacterales bacterium]|nr:sigma 54-interacting transcriptional regulator [Desulfobacterales bacterium]